MRVLLVRSADSPPTYQTFLLGELIKRNLISWGYRITDIVDPFRSTGIFSKGLIKSHDVIIYLGHGEVDRLYGNFWLGYWIPFLSVKSKDVARGKIIITYACLSGRVLGPTLVKSDTKAYSGSDYYMYVAYDGEIPYSEYYYKPFLRMIEEFFRRGRSLSRAVSVYKSLARTNARKLMSMKDNVSRDYGHYLKLNAEHYKVIGDARL